MAFTAQSVADLAWTELQDAGGVRWPASDMIGWLNLFLIDLAVNRPDAVSKAAPLVLAAGIRQALPADGVKLLEVTGVTGGRYMSKVADRHMLDASAPRWRTMPQTKTLRHFLYDEREPRVFEVYPPAAAGTSVDIVYAAKPAAIAALADNLPVPDIFQGAALDYLLFRCFSKDAEYAGDANRASGHLQLFAQALGIELKATILSAPNRRGSSNAANAMPASTGAAQ